MVKDTTYYDILQVDVTASDIELKKAYRKRAIMLHPDKNGNDPKAAEKFQDLVEAYGVLQNAESRALYDEVGVEGMKLTSPEAAADIDPNEFMSMVFGGEGFRDWIGELSMISDLSKTAEILEEEPGAEEAEAKNESSASDLHVGDLHISEHSSKQNQLSSESIKKKKKQKITKEQREKMAQLQEQLKVEKQKRVDDLSVLLISLIERYIAAQHNKEALDLFNSKLQQEFEDLKIESFGIQMLHLIGTIYTNQAHATSRSLKTFGVSKIYSSVKTKTNTVKTGFSILKTALDAQYAVEEMVKQQEQLQRTTDAGGEITEAEQYQQMEMERMITGKFLATAWASTKYEITTILNKVCDKVLNDRTLDRKHRLARADAMLYLGKKMLDERRTPEEEEEARIFEEMMADATAKKSKTHRTHFADPKLAEFVNEHGTETPSSESSEK